MVNPLSALVLSVLAGSTGLQPAGPNTRPTLKPSKPGIVQPGTPSTGAALAPGQLVRQGSFIVSRRGRVVRGDAGEVIFVFDADAQGKAEAPMVLLPISHLQNLERIADKADASTRFNISGQVTSYHQRNYLLMDRPAEIVRVAPVATPSEPAMPAAKPSDEPKPAPSDASDPDAMMKSMEKSAASRDTARPIVAPAAPAPAPTAASDTPAPAMGSGKAQREGTFIASRRGRLIRQPTGEWNLTFDADASGKSDAPMPLLPCLNLMAMEKLAERGGESATMSVSGVVTFYKGKNYLLPTMYVLNRKTEIVPGQ
jgi:hypothetical protein